MADPGWNWCTILLLTLLISLLTVIIIVSTFMCAVSMRQSNVYRPHDYDEVPYVDRRGQPYGNVSRNNLRTAWYRGHGPMLPLRPPMMWPPASPEIMVPFPYNHSGNFSCSATCGYDVPTPGVTVKEVKEGMACQELNESANALGPEWDSASREDAPLLVPDHSYENTGMLCSSDKTAANNSCIGIDSVTTPNSADCIQMTYEPAFSCRKMPMNSDHLNARTQEHLPEYRELSYNFNRLAYMSEHEMFLLNPSQYQMSDGRTDSVFVCDASQFVYGDSDVSTIGEDKDSETVSGSCTSLLASYCMENETGLSLSDQEIWEEVQEEGEEIDWTSVPDVSSCHSQDMEDGHPTVASVPHQTSTQDADGSTRKTIIKPARFVVENETSQLRSKNPTSESNLAVLGSGKTSDLGQSFLGSSASQTAGQDADTEVPFSHVGLLEETECLSLVVEHSPIRFDTKRISNMKITCRSSTDKGDFANATGVSFEEMSGQIQSTEASDRSDRDDGENYCHFKNEDRDLDKDEICVDNEQNAESYQEDGADTTQVSDTGNGAVNGQCEDQWLRTGVGHRTGLSTHAQVSGREDINVPLTTNDCQFSVVS